MPWPLQLVLKWRDFEKYNNKQKFRIYSESTIDGKTNNIFIVTQVELVLLHFFCTSIMDYT